MRNNNILTLGEAIDEFLKAFKLGRKFAIANVETTWYNVAGPYIAQHTKKVSFSKGCLFLRFESAALRTEMMYVRSSIIKRMNEMLGQEIVKDVHIS